MEFWAESTKYLFLKLGLLKFIDIVKEFQKLKLIKLTVFLRCIGFFMYFIKMKNKVD